MKLPKKRPRALTAPLPHPRFAFLTPKSSKQTTTTQLNSPLCNLPLELRQQILHLVILDTSSVIHIFRLRSEERLGFWRCGNSVEGRPCDWDTPCDICLPYGSRYLNNDGTWITRGQKNCIRTFRSDLAAGTTSSCNLLSLLCSCREIYSEMIEIVYSILHFHFPNPEDILTFSRSTLPCRLQTIKNLSLDLGWTDHRPSQPQPWSDDLWRLLSKMKCLRQLRIYVKKFFGEDGQEPFYLQVREGVKRLKGLDVCKVIAPAEQRELWGSFMEGGIGIKVVLSESPEEPIDPFT